MYNQFSAKQLIEKLEQYCAYQERCHQDVLLKIRSLTNDANEADSVIVHLINHNFLNEERFAKAFARGKHRIKHWGKSRIKAELRRRDISDVIIKAALAEIDDDDYIANFNAVAERQWTSISETNIFKRRRKFCDFLLRKGYDSAEIYRKLQELENNSAPDSSQ